MFPRFCDSVPGPGAELSAQGQCTKSSASLYNSGTHICATDRT